MTAQGTLTTGTTERFVREARRAGWRVKQEGDSRHLTTVHGRLVLANDTECRGWPTLFCAHTETGRVLAVHVRHDRAPLADDEQVWADALAACGIETLVLHPGSLDAALSRLSRSRVAA